MPRHYLMWSTGDDSIEVYTEEPTVVVRALRADLEALLSLEEAERPGIYRSAV